VELAQRSTLGPFNQGKRPQTVAAYSGFLIKSRVALTESARAATEFVAFGAIFRLLRRRVRALPLTISAAMPMLLLSVFGGEAQHPVRGLERRLAELDYLDDRNVW
jgi:hypothetical protein